MENPTTFTLIADLIWQLPNLAVYGTAGVVALVFLRRAPLPAALVLFGVVISLLAIAAAVATNVWMTNARLDGVRNYAEQAQMRRVLGFLISCVRALGYGLFIAAAFVGRSSVEEQQLKHPGR